MLRSCLFREIFSNQKYPGRHGLGNYFGHLHYSLGQIHLLWLNIDEMFKSREVTNVRVDAFMDINAEPRRRGEILRA